MPSRKVLEQKRSSNQSDRRGIVGSSAHHDINDKIIASFERGDIAKLLATIASHLPRMNLVNMITGLHRLSKLTSTSCKSNVHLQDEHAFRELLSSISGAFHTMEPEKVSAQSLSNTAWSLAALNLTPLDLLTQMAALGMANLPLFKPFELAIFLQACVKLGATDDSAALCLEPIFGTAAAHILAHPDTFQAPCSAKVLWALISAKKPQDISSTLLAIAKSFGGSEGGELAPCNADPIGLHDRPLPEVPAIVHQLFEVASPWLIPRLLTFSATSLASLSRAFAMMPSIGSHRLIEAVRNEASKRYDQDSCSADLRDCLDAMSLGKWNQLACNIAAPIHSTRKKKKKSKQRGSQALGAVDVCLQDKSAWMNSYRCHDEVVEFENHTVDAAFHSQSYHANFSWTFGVGVVVLPQVLEQEQDCFIQPIDVDVGKMTAPQPIHEASSTPQLPPQAEFAKGPEECSSMHHGRGHLARPPLVEGCQLSPNTKWNCLVRNSFLHVEMSDDTGSIDVQSSCEGGSFRRSSSVPRHLGRA
mmetsp:Transcript_59989/g.152110  ORF Transcript_59989/g.152110 Transcript_59989/m.152110 type:complete len:531 (+) Transcript_59989:83-1675(+)